MIANVVLVNDIQLKACNYRTRVSCPVKGTGLKAMTNLDVDAKHDDTERHEVSR